MSDREARKDSPEPAESQDRQLRALLRTLAHDPADGGFSARLHRRLVEQGAPAAAPRGVRAWLGALGRRPILVGSLAGACTGVAAFALLMTLTPGSLPPRAQRPAHTPAQAVAACDPTTTARASAEVFVVPQGKVALVQLDFAVDHDVEAAEFSVLLPDGLSFFSAGEALPERSFRWSAPLGHGDNRIPIAVIGTRPGRHHLTATATIAGEVVVHEVVLDVREPA